MRKPVFGGSERVRHKPACSATEDGKRFEISDLGRKEIVSSMKRSSEKIKALISCAVTLQLICAFFRISKSQVFS